MGLTGVRWGSSLYNWMPKRLKILRTYRENDQRKQVQKRYTGMHLGTFKTLLDQDLGSLEREKRRPEGELRRPPKRIPNHTNRNIHQNSQGNSENKLGNKISLIAELLQS